MESEKKYFAGWWFWVLLLIIISIIALGALNVGQRVFGVAAERIIFENSIQRSQAEKTERSILESQLREIEVRLRDSTLTESERIDLKAHQANLRSRINSM